MNIVDNLDDQVLSLKYLNAGDVCRFIDNNALFIKSDGVAGDDSIIILNLKNGVIEYADKTDKVRKVAGQFKVE